MVPTISNNDRTFLPNGKILQISPAEFGALAWGNHIYIKNHRLTGACGRNRLTPWWRKFTTRHVQLYPRGDMVGSPEGEA